MAHKLDIFDTLAAIDRRERDFLDRQSPEARKGFAPVVVIRWASATQGQDTERMLTTVNRTVNRHLFAIGDHPELQYLLMASCGSGRKQRHDWIPLPKTRRVGSKLHGFIAKYWPDANDQEIDLIIGQFTRETFKRYVETSGIDPSEIKGLLDAYSRHTKKENGSAGTG